MVTHLTHLTTSHNTLLSIVYKWYNLVLKNATSITDLPITCVRHIDKFTGRYTSVPLSSRRHFLCFLKKSHRTLLDRNTSDSTWSEAKWDNTITHVNSGWLCAFISSPLFIHLCLISWFVCTPCRLAIDKAAPRKPSAKEYRNRLCRNVIVCVMKVVNALSQLALNYPCLNFPGKWPQANINKRWHAGIISKLLK